MSRDLARIDDTEDTRRDVFCADDVRRFYIAPTCGRFYIGPRSTSIEKSRTGPHKASKAVFYLEAATHGRPELAPARG